VPLMNTRAQYLVNESVLTGLFGVGLQESVTYRDSAPKRYARRRDQNSACRAFATRTYSE
jgi:hypothetical protein